LLHWDIKGNDTLTSGSNGTPSPEEIPTEAEQAEKVCAAGNKLPPSACKNGAAIFKVVHVKVWAGDSERPIPTMPS